MTVDIFTNLEGLFIPEEITGDYYSKNWVGDLNEYQLVNLLNKFPQSHMCVDRNSEGLVVGFIIILL